MSINANQIVKVIPRVINAGASELEIVGLFLTENPLCPFPAAMSFSTASAVGAYFGLDSAEYAAAARYFVGYNNSFTKPKRLWFAKHVTEAMPGSYVGTGTVAKLTELKAITTGACTLIIDGNEVILSGLDFSAANTESAIAEIFTNSLDDKAVVTYDSNLKEFIIRTTSKLENSTIEVKVDGGASGVKVLEPMGLATGSSWAGSPALTPAVNMAKIVERTQNWVSFTTLKEVTKEVALQFAAWVSTMECEYLYCAYTTNKDDKNPAVTNNLPNELKNGGYEGVILTYGGIEYAGFVMSLGASIDWERTNGLVTYAFKSQDGLAATIDNDTDASNCNDMKVNFYGNYATRNDDFLFYYQGAMTDGSKFGFADAYVGQVWLRNVIQVACVNGLAQLGRVPYKEEGYTYIRAWIQDPVARALVNGVIDAGVKMSEAQKAQIISETGDTSAPDAIFLNGYYLQVTDPSAAVRAVRGTPVIGLWYTYGGSVHRMEIPTTVIQ